MVVGERYAVDFAKLPESVGLVSRIAPPHPRTRAELRKSEAPPDSLRFVGDKTVVEADIVGDEDAVSHELQERVGDLCEQRRVANHFVRDAGELDDFCRN